MKHYAMAMELRARQIIFAILPISGVVGRLIAGEECQFNVCCPKAFASIKGLSAGTPLFDRSITIHMEPGTVPFVNDKEQVQQTDALLLQLESYEVQKESHLLRMLDEVNQNDWPEIQRRDRELWSPLLLHARLAGSKIEARTEALAKQFCQEKRSAQSQDDTTIALARELVYALEKIRTFELTSGKLVKLVQDAENWGDTLAGKNVKAQAGFMGRFLRNFRPAFRVLDGKNLYQRKNTLIKLQAHLPPKEST